MELIQIRAAILDDLPILLEFEQGIIRAERPLDETLKQEEHISYYDIKAMILSEDTEVLVAVAGDEPIGSAYITIKKAKPYFKHTYFGFLGFMYVKPEYRGKGVNKKVMEAIKLWSKEKSIKELRLHVYETNIPAIKAYEKTGFQKHLIEMRMTID